MDEINLEVSREEMLRRWTIAQERLNALESEQRRRGDLSREASELHAENAILKGQLEKLSSEVKLKNEQINELFKKWQNGNITFLLKENGELSRKWRFAEDRAEEAKQIMQSAQNALADKEHHLSSAIGQLNEKDSQISILLRKFEDLRAENQRLQSDLQLLHNEGLGRLEEKIQEISSLRVDHDRQEQRMRQEVHEMETGYQEKDIELQKLGVQFGQFKMQFQQECMRLQDENRALREILGDKAPPLPARSVQGTAVPAQSASASRTKLKRIMLVESHPESAAMISGVLTEAGYEVFAASTADQILAACGSQSVDALLINIIADDIDVYALSHQLVQDSPAKTVPIILMASNPQSTEIFKQEGSQSVQSYLYKPFSREDLLATLDFVAASRGNAE